MLQLHGVPEKVYTEMLPQALADCKKRNPQYAENFRIEDGAVLFAWQGNDLIIYSAAVGSDKLVYCEIPGGQFPVAPKSKGADNE